MPMTAGDFRKAWRGFFIDLELARHWDGTAVLKAFGRPLGPNPLLDKVIPSLFHLRLASLLDEVLAEFIEETGIPKPRGYREDLHHRILLVGERGIVEGSGELLGFKDKRNLIAHEGDHATWDELGDAIDMVEALLIKMGYVDKRPDFRWYAERSAFRGSQAAGVIGEQDYCYGLKEGDRKIIEVKWTESLMDDDQ